MLRSDSYGWWFSWWRFEISWCNRFKDFNFGVTFERR